MPKAYTLPPLTETQYERTVRAINNHADECESMRARHAHLGNDGAERCLGEEARDSFELAAYLKRTVRESETVPVASDAERVAHAYTYEQLRTLARDAVADHRKLAPEEWRGARIVSIEVRVHRRARRETGDRVHRALTPFNGAN